MAAQQQPARGGPTDPSHDALLRRGILHTEVSRPAATALCAAFLLLITGIPLAQAWLEWRAEEPSSLAPLLQRAPSRENLHQFEHDLEEASYFKAYVQPRVQQLLTRWGAEGNKRVVVGSAGFLFYTPGLMHLAGPSFVDREVQKNREAQAREHDAAELHADPLAAIFAFQAMLARRGITLILFPVPDKTMLQPMQLHGRGRRSQSIAVANNPGWPAFCAMLAQHGLKLFDASPRAISPGEPARYLIQDTHWAPRFMRQVARDLAAFVEREVPLPPASGAQRWHAVSERVERVGDLVDMLKLPEDQHVFRPQSVEIDAVRDAAGEPWEPQRSAEVLLLGDSFTNVFSLDSMEWGQAAGLAPQLSLALGRDVDVIAQNDAGAHATREALYRELSAGSDRLAGKRVVIWEFAARELSVGDFKEVAWDSLPAAASQTAQPPRSP